MTKETKFYVWLGVGIAAAVAVVWWMNRNAAVGAPPPGAKVTP